MAIDTKSVSHDDVIKWKHFPRYWPFVRGIHRSPVNSPHKGQWRGALMFSLICARINSWVNNGEAGDLRRHRGHYDVIVMILCYVLEQSVQAAVAWPVILRVLSPTLCPAMVFKYKSATNCSGGTIQDQSLMGKSSLKRLFRWWMLQGWMRFNRGKSCLLMTATDLELSQHYNSLPLLLYGYVRHQSGALGPSKTTD